MTGVGSVAIIEQGTGPPVMLVHGLNGFKEGWGPLPGALAAAGMRAVMVDLPGFGASPRVRRGRTDPATIATVVEALAQRTGPAAVVAHSLGTQAAMLAAAARPGLVRRLVLISPWVLSRPRRFPPRSVSDLLQIPVLGRLLARLAIARMRRSPQRRTEAFRSVVADAAGLTRDPAMAALLAEASARLEHADVAAMADWAASALALDIRPLAARLEAPALVVVGGADRVTRAPGVRRLAEALPHGRLLELDGVGHFPHLERPGVVLPAIVEHLR